jgi:hypothetical protein
VDKLLEQLKNIGESTADVAKLKKLVESFWQKEFKKLNESEWDEKTSNLYQHAKHELQLAGMFDKDSDYNGMLGEAALEVVKIFAKQGHSGGSAAITIGMLEKLLRFETLTPITDNPGDWVNVVEHYGADKGFDTSLWQCKRNPALFSTDGGKTYYHVDKHTNIMTSEKMKA